MTDSLESISRAASDCLEKGDTARALELYLEAVPLASAAGMQAELSGLLGDMAVAYRRMGSVPAAIETNRRAIEAARACGHDLDIARWSGNLGGLLYLGEDIDGAETCFREAAAAAARSGSPEQMSIAAGQLAAVMGERGRFSEAVDIMAQALEHAKGHPEVTSIILDQELGLLLRWAYSLREASRLREARDVVNRALTNLTGRPPVKEEVMLLILLGDIEENEGDIEAACEAIERAVKASDAIGDQERAKQLREVERRMRG